MMDRIDCVIVEDRLTDAEYLKSMIETHPMLHLQGIFENALSAVSYIRANNPRLIFMDIDMPVINGIEFFRQLNPQPICIFVTAYSEHAWESYEVQAFDFILKPVKKERFDACMTRLKEYFTLLSRSDIYESHVEKNTITIKEGTTKHIIDINDILYIEALRDYSKVVTASKKIMTLSKLKHFLEQLPGEHFVRIHRSYAVAVKSLKTVSGNEVFIQDIRLPVGKTFKHALMRII